MLRQKSERLWMLSKRFWILLVTKISTIVVVIGINRMGRMGQLASPAGNGVPTESVSPAPTPAPSHIPKTFNFDSSTDLKTELNKVDPQISDSDFE